MTMTAKQRAITLEHARTTAERGAHSLLKDFVRGESTPLLQESFLEADHCWMFFRNKDIAIPPEQGLCDGAYVVSKNGSLRHIVDFSADPEKLKAYLQTMSDYFKERGE